MITTAKLSDKKVLIIDDLAEMRSLLQMTMASLNFDKVHVVPNIQTALERISEHKYSIILCDYSLGDSTNGQQFLEYLRTRDLISRNTIFIMVTAEQSYEKVVVASECEPDDYLLKPFTGAQFLSRLEKLLERQEKFLAVDKATDTKNWTTVITECNKLLAQKDRHFIETCKIKGSALLKAGKAQEAAELYGSVISIRPIAWAKLGLAHAKLALNDHQNALAIAREVLTENTQYIAAYDFISQTLASTGNKNEALAMLEKAREISPGTMTRIRELGKIANSVGRHDLAEQVISQALSKNRYSPVREAHDYALLSSAQTQLGKTDLALETLKTAKASFKDNVSKVLLAATESITHQKSGNPVKAQAVLQEALTADRSAMPADTLASIAEACFALGKDEHATDLLKHIVQNNPENTRLHGRVHDVLAASGKNPAEAHAIIQASVREVVHINNEGVRKAEAGELTEAIELLSSAADRLPDNMQIVSNAALVLALAQVRLGRDPIRLKACMGYRQRLIEKAPEHPKLAHIDSLLKQIPST